MVFGEEVGVSYCRYGVYSPSNVLYLVTVWFWRILRRLDLVEIILVELSYKTRKVVVLEMSGQDGFGELVGFSDDKGLSTLAPADDPIVLFFFEHAVC